MRRFNILAAALVAGLGLTACGRSAGAFRPGSVQPAASAVTVSVSNNNFSDMDVYAISEGVATRVGTVTGQSQQTFVLDPSYFPSNQLRLVAVPIGGNGRAVSGVLAISPGETIQFDVQPILRNSMAVVH